MFALLLFLNDHLGIWTSYLYVCNVRYTRFSFQKKVFVLFQTSEYLLAYQQEQRQHNQMLVVPEHWQKQ